MTWNNVSVAWQLWLLAVVQLFLTLDDIEGQVRSVIAPWQPFATTRPSESGRYSAHIYDTSSLCCLPVQPRLDWLQDYVWPCVVVSTAAVCATGLGFTSRVWEVSFHKFFRLTKYFTWGTSIHHCYHSVSPKIGHHFCSRTWEKLERTHFQQGNTSPRGLTLKCLSTAEDLN